MPESNAAAKRREQKQNRAMGIGDEQGRLVRVKDPPKMATCAICRFELKITKTNAELIAHSESKHNSTLDECFPGAKEISAELIAAATKDKAGGGGSGNKGGGGLTKAQMKKKTEAGLDDLLSAGLSGGPGKKKGKN